ncbi:hypothetical protein V2117_002922 [Enterococcus faecalis]|nr:hypothetical protein [Lactobacillus sp.]
MVAVILIVIGVTYLYLLNDFIDNYLDVVIDKVEDVKYDLFILFRRDKR